MWHLEKRAKDLADGLDKFETKVTPSKARLRKAFSASSKGVEALLTGVLAGSGF